MTIYSGMRTATGALVLVDDNTPLPQRIDLWKHSSTGFEWGYGGSGPAQLALAILAHHCGDAAAVEFHQAFKREIVARLPHDTWNLSSDVVDDFMADQLARRAKGQR